jgi:mannobiose 2-epimerase
MNEPLRNELEGELRRLAAVWFPRTIDEKYGGFLCDFDFRWRLSGPQCKMLEYQARQTLAAARAAAHYPDSSVLRDAALHGYRYLKERMWDPLLGGWYRMLDQQGAPLEGSTKHGHGYSYAISACVACHRLTADPECLSLAQQAFQWIDRYAHDGEFGGYHAFLERDGTPIRSAARAPRPDQTHDPIGTPIGLKDANSTSDLLKCFSELYAVWPDPSLKRRLMELLAIVRDRLVVPPGAMHMYTHPDWTPLPEPVRYGQVIRSANILVLAAHALGEAGNATSRVAKSMVDAMLGAAWDRKNGGFNLAGSAFGSISVEDTVIYVGNKRWWPQAEGMTALALMTRLYPAEAERYSAYFGRLWDYVRKYLIDARHGGWFATGLDTNRHARKWPKATMWKDASHEIETLLECIGRGSKQDAAPSRDGSIPDPETA